MKTLNAQHVEKYTPLEYLCSDITGCSALMPCSLNVPCVFIDAIEKIIWDPIYDWNISVIPFLQTSRNFANYSRYNMQCGPLRSLKITFWTSLATLFFFLNILEVGKNMKRLFFLNRIHNLQFCFKPFLLSGFV